MTKSALTLSDLVTANERRATWLCRLRGHRFIATTVERELHHDCCFRCGFDRGMLARMRTRTAPRTAPRTETAQVT